MVRGEQPGEQAEEATPKIVTSSNNTIRIHFHAVYMLTPVVQKLDSTIHWINSYHPVNMC